MIDCVTGECWLDEFPGHLPLIPYTVDKYTKVDCIVPLHSHQYSNVQIGCIYHLKKPATLIPRVLITQIDFYLTKTILHCVTDEQCNCLTMIVDKFIDKKQYILPNGYVKATDINHCIVVLTHTTQYHLIAPSYMTLNTEAQKYIQPISPRQVRQQKKTAQGSRVQLFFLFHYLSSRAMQTRQKK